MTMPSPTGPASVLASRLAPSRPRQPRSGPVVRSSSVPVDWPGRGPDPADAAVSGMSELLFSPVRKDEQAKAFATLVSAFMDDPVERWLYPELQQYLTHFPSSSPPS